MSARSSSEPTSPLEKVRPPFIRSRTEASEFHPTLSARAQLGDTGGAVYLPTSGAPCKLTTATKTSISIFGPSGRNSPQSARAHDPASQSKCAFPISTTWFFPEVRHRVNTYPSAAGSTDQDSSESNISPVWTDAASSNDAESSAASSAHSRAQECRVFDSRLAKTMESTEISASKTDNTQSQIYSLDGTYDGDFYRSKRFKLERVASSDQLHFKSSRSANVSFVGDNELRKRSMAVQLDDDDSSPFLDPFTGMPVFDETNMSDISHASEYLRPNAFSGHRDTLARIHPAYLTRSNGTNQWYTPSSRKLSIDFSVEAGKRFPGHRDSLARLHSNHNKAKVIPLKVLDRIFNFLSFQDYKNLRLTCRQWYEALPCVMLPPSCRLPAEVLHQIYQYLQPCEFDAARHTCRSWFLASLDRKTGRSMMERAGCHSAFLADIEQRRQILHSRHLRRLKQVNVGDDDDCISDHQESDEDTFNEEWLISKRLATESRLSATWHGSGITKDGSHSASRLTTTTIVDFQKLVNRSESDKPRVKRFTVSSCGCFALVVVGTDILVYSLNSESSIMRPCVRLVADKDVLNVTMDTSCGRYAVAALLEGRTGMCWDVEDLFNPGQAAFEAGDSITLGMQAEVYGMALSSSPAPELTFLRDERTELVAKSGNGKEDNEGSHDRPSRSVDSTRPDGGQPALSPIVVSSQTSPLRSTEVTSTDSLVRSTVLPIRIKPSNVYQNLGYLNDSPSSVAICPYRKSVAFGCKTGIELHWVDSLTGSDVNRWFPLAAPSDYLYFLPQRPGLDSCKKLRLISSAVEPSGGAVNRNKNSDCDHFRAIPLSDGTHVLFTDPATGILCLGSNTPSGGPTKFVRKMCLNPPVSVNSTRRSLKSYAVGRDLSWGIRVVAAYEDGNIVLFNVPSDYFERIRNLRSSSDVWDETNEVLDQNDSVDDPAAVNPVNDPNFLQSTADPPTPGSFISFRSLHIQGTSICKVDPDVEDLQVDCYGGGLRLWIFNRSGCVRKMDLYTARNQRTLSYTVDLDGALHSVTDIPDIRLSRSLSRQTETGNGADPNLGNHGNHIKFVGLDGTCDDDDKHCSTSDVERHLERLERLNKQSLKLFPNQDVSYTPQGMRAAESEQKLQLEVLTDFRNTMLLSPYMLNLE